MFADVREEQTHVCVGADDQEAQGHLVQDLQS